MIQHAAQLHRVDAHAVELLSTTAEGVQYQFVPWRLHLPRPAVSWLLTALEPQLVAAAERDDYQLFFLIARALHRAGWGQPALDRIAEQGLGAATNENAASAARVWLANPATRAERVGSLLTFDRSFATLHVVAQAICRHRQDLVEVFYDSAPVRGRFRHGKSSWLAVLDGPFGGWLPQHLSSYRQALAAKLAKPSTTEYDRRQLLLCMAKLPGTTVKDLSGYLRTAAARESMLEAMVHLDEPEPALAQLVSYADTDHAYVAMYAARPLVQRIAPTRAAALLAPSLGPAARATARKEAIRLLGLLRLPDTLSVVAATGLDPHQVRDVRIAAGRTLLEFLHDDQAWEVIAKLAVSGRDEAIALARTYPTQLAARHRTRFAEIIASANSESEGVNHLARWAEYVSLAGLRSPILDNHTIVGQLAAHTFADCARASSDWSVVFSVVEELLRRSHSSTEPDAQEMLDRPHARRLKEVIEQILDGSWEDAIWHRESLRRLAEIIGDQPDVVDLTWQLLLHTVQWHSPIPDLINLALTTRDASLTHPLYQAVYSFLVRQEEDIHGTLSLDTELIDTLLVMAEPGAAAIALAVVLYQGHRLGWPEPWRQRLRRLRGHPLAIIAGCASRFFTTIGS